MLLLGCRPVGRHTEQHDIFFGIGKQLSDLKQDIIDFWPEANGNIHIDAWREVTQVDEWKISVIDKNENSGPIKHLPEVHLFFLNLGGYKSGEFEEYHYKMILACNDKATAIKKAKQTAFYRHTGFKGAASHIDDKYGVDVDDAYMIGDILSTPFKQQYRIVLENTSDENADELHLGYLKLEKI